eukprot:XP_019074222.1 PREDICTED: LOW QUALITY PROTEIN: laccase-15-like [Vitis vinifera]
MWLIMKVFLLQILAFLLFGGGIYCQASTRRLTFVVKEASYTRLCSTKNILTVNGQFPGPTIYAKKGETIIVDVYNKGKENITIHWHGVSMPRYPWTDGPEYITQCPIQPGSKFSQKIILSFEEGTLWWHAHSDWTRNTVHGAIIIYPKNGTKYPFPKPNAEIPIILGQWWKSDARMWFEEALATGADPNASDSLLINGQPGDLFPCSKTAKLIYTVGMNSYLCPNNSCAGPNGTRFSASINNISFQFPTIDILQAYYYNISGVYGDKLPSVPELVFDFTTDIIPLEYQTPKNGTEVRVLEYNSTVEIVFQGTNLIAGTHHPMHLHGYSFYVVGWGFGNFDKDKDPLHYNLVDPPLQSTISIPTKGWAAIRFEASNPGVWFMHCHVERHQTWGMDTAFIVKNGKHPEAQVLPPPSDMPPC